MLMTTDHLIANPCDDEEDNLAMLCCLSAQGEMFMMSRYPDEDELDITLGENDPSTVEGVKVTLSAGRLLIEVAAQDSDAFNGEDHLDIRFDPAATDLDDVEQTLKIILDGTGTYISELS